MENLISYKQVQSKVITIRNENVILDSDVAALYGVETKRINEAVTNNPDKFPDGYIIALTDDEMQVLRSKISTLENGKGHYSKYNAKAFTEKGLYMLATILKSPVATKTTIAIVETFAKIKELSRTMSELSSSSSDSPEQKSLMLKSGEILADILDDGLEVSDTETSIEVNFAVMKFKHTVKKGRKEKARIGEK
jgi:hypothetical protein